MTTLAPVAAVEMIREIKAHLDVALRYGLQLDRPLYHGDLEHIQTASVLAKMLLEAQKGAVNA